MKPYLVDVPVRVNIWIRPECQRRQFEVIKQARPSILFLISDGGRNEKEWENIRNNRKMIDEGIDWECTVYRIYEEKNNGLYAMGVKCRKLVWSKVDRCIFLEDDILPNVSYFSYCSELLEKYKDDNRVEVVCGMNHLGKCEHVTSDYFFSRQGSIWGSATWKRVHENRHMDYTSDKYAMSLLKQRTKRNKRIWELINGYAKDSNYGGHIAGSEFWYCFNMYSQNSLQIIPKVNLVSNIGCTKDSQHSDDISQIPKGLRRVFNMETYEMDFPMKHPVYVMPDVDYEKKRNRIMAYNHPFVAFYRKAERLLRKVLSGDFSYIKNKLKQKRNGEK